MNQNATIAGMVRKWLAESKATKYLTTHDEDQLVQICLHSYETGKAHNAKLTHGATP